MKKREQSTQNPGSSDGERSPGQAVNSDIKEMLRKKKKKWGMNYSLKMDQLNIIHQLYGFIAGTD